MWFLKKVTVTSQDHPKSALFDDQKISGDLFKPNFGGIKLDAKMYGNFEGPISVEYSCIVRVGNIMTPVIAVDSDILH